jgi:hypothetical protein
VDVTGALAFDHSRIVIGNAQRHLGAELLREIGQERTESVSHARSIFCWDHGKDELGILGLPVLCVRHGREG